MRMHVYCPVPFVITLLITGCQGQRSPPPTNAPISSAPNDSAKPAEDTPLDTLMKLRGPFANQSPIDRKYTGEAVDLSPPLAWSGAPSGTQSFALICDDPDAPSPKRPAAEPWVHWVIYNVPVSVSELPAGIPREPQPKQVPGACQGKNSWPSDNVGYHGPMPPPGSGTHRYFFRLYALDCNLKIELAGANKSTLLAATRGHVLAEAQLIGTYERK